MPTTIPLEFADGDTPTNVNGIAYFFVACRSRHDGKVRVFGAYYLSDEPLHYEDGCAECPSNEDECPAHHGFGCPTTGWFTETYDAEYDRSWERVDGTVLGFAKQPQFPTT